MTSHSIADLCMLLKPAHHNSPNHVDANPNIFVTMILTCKGTWLLGVVNVPVTVCSL